MYEWSEEQLMVRDAIRRFIDAEVVPHIDAVEHDGVPPYDIIRKMYATSAWTRWPGTLQEAARAQGGRHHRVGLRAGRAGGRRGCGGHDAHPDHRAVPPLSGHRDLHGRERRPGRRDHHEGRHPGPDGAVGLDLLTAEKVGAWAITEPKLRLGRPRRMTTMARRDGDEYVINGSKDVDHQRALCRHHRAVRQAGRRLRHPHPRPPGADVSSWTRHPRPRAVQAAPQDGPPTPPHR